MAVGNNDKHGSAFILPSNELDVMFRTDLVDDLRDKTSQAYIRYRKDIEARAMGLKRGAYKMATATIITPARQWKPNENRKLPRLWIRENFIP
jgi:hypothetical protein